MKTAPISAPPSLSRRIFCAALALLLLGFAVPARAQSSGAPEFYPFTDPQGNPVTTVSGYVGAPLTQQVAATDITSPGGYGATGLPSGLRIDPDSGLISGVPTAYGVFNVALTATNSAGSATATLPFDILPPLVTLTVKNASGRPAAGMTASFQITRAGDTSQELLVNAVMKGSAKSGKDYSAITLPIKIKAGKAKKVIHIQAVDLSGQGITVKTVKLALRTGDTYSLPEKHVAKVKVFYTP